MTGVSPFPDFIPRSLHTLACIVCNCCIGFVVKVWLVTPLSFSCIDSLICDAFTNGYSQDTPTQSMSTYNRKHREYWKILHTLFIYLHVCYPFDHYFAVLRENSHDCVAQDISRYRKCSGTRALHKTEAQDNSHGCHCCDVVCCVLGTNTVPEHVAILGQL